MSKFLFVYPHMDYSLCVGCRNHMGAAYIRTFGNYTPSEVGAFLSDNRASWGETAKAIARSAEIGVGFTVYETNYVIVALLARRLKVLRPELLVVCGGPTAMFSYQRILRDCSAIDLCVIGEGEVTFSELYQTEFAAEAWPEISGLVMRKDDGFHRTEARAQYRNPDDKRQTLRGIGSPYLRGIVSPSEAPFLGIYTTRGCNYDCTFCSFSTIGGHTIRCFPESQILEEFEFICGHFRETGKQVTIPINDDNFAWDVKRCKRILEGIAEFRPENVRFFIDVRADNIHGDEEFFELAKVAGMGEINFGLESASPQVLSLVQKLRRTRDKSLKKEEQYIEDVKASVHAAYRRGIACTVSIILGLPGDTPQRASATLDLVKNLPLDTYYHNILNVYDGTELSHTCRDFGLDRVEREGWLFPATKYAYDAEAIPMLPNASEIQDYRRGALFRTISALTGMLNRYVFADTACIVFDHGGDLDPKKFERLPSGTMFLVMPGNKRDFYWGQQGYLSHAIVPQGTQGPDHIVKPPTPGEATRVPLLKLVGEDKKVHEGRACIEFVELGPADSIPESRTNHWRLPHAACGLLPDRCPADTGKLLSNAWKESLCAFYPVEQASCRKNECESCPVKDVCPRCPYLLNSFEETYCQYHREGKSWQLLGYLMAHLQVLVDPKTDLTSLPAIHCEGKQSPETGISFIRIGESYVLSRQGRIFEPLSNNDKSKTVMVL